MAIIEKNPDIFMKSYGVVKTIAEQNLDRFRKWLDQDDLKMQFENLSLSSAGISYLTFSARTIFDRNF